MPKRHRLRRVLCLAFTCLWVTIPALAVDVVVVKSNDLGAYDKAIAGFKEAFKGSTTEVEMQGRLEDPGNLASAVREAHPRAILAVGLRAVTALRGEITDLPIVFCMAAHPSQNSLRGANITGVDLETQTKDQLRAFKDVIPGMKKLGVIYDPKRSASIIQDARKAVAEIGISLMERPIEERKNVPDALKDIIQGADSLWLIRDATVVTKEFFDQTLLLQVEKKFPLLAYSDQFVRKGAVCSYSASYQGQGKKAAQVVQSILDGAKAGDMPVQTPEGVLVINLGSASKANVKVPQSVLQRPGTVTVDQ